LYKDLIRVGAETYATVFQLIDEAALRLVLREARVLTPLQQQRAAMCRRKV
jgi:hypothetical protein